MKKLVVTTLTVVLAAGCGKLNLDDLKKAAATDATSSKPDSNADATSKKASSDASAAKASEKASDAPKWKEIVTGEETDMAMTDLTPGGLPGMSMLATKASKVTKSVGGTGAEITDSAYGFDVWVHEDPTATLDLMKSAASAWNKDAKIVTSDDHSFIVSWPDYDGRLAYYYRGLYRFGGKSIRCETPTSISPGAQSHAEQIGKACASLVGAGGAVADKPAAPSDSGTAVAQAAVDPSPPSQAATPNSGHASSSQGSNGGSAKPASQTKTMGGSATPPKANTRKVGTH